MTVRRKPRLSRQTIKLSAPLWSGYAGAVALSASLVWGCGKKREFDHGEELTTVVLGGGGGGRVQSGTQVITNPGVTTKQYGICKTQVPIAKPVYDIVPVTRIIEATGGIDGWAPADLPFTGGAVALGSPVSDGQTPFQFKFDYPENNFQLTQARLVIDTSRDNSDTEGIFVEGVFSGRPPTDMVNMTSSKITHPVYFGSGAETINTYYIDFSLAHYKRQTRNTFDLELAKLLEPSDSSAADVLVDGEVNVVTGDDSPVYQAYLVIKGLTTTSEDLNCAMSDTFTFTNVYLHDDGNTIGEAAFSGAVGTPFTSFPSPGTYPSFEFNFDAPLPQVDAANIEITSANLTVTAKRTAAGSAAIVINGIGISESGFDRSTATQVVETWNDEATAAFESFVANVPTTANGASRDLDLIELLGAETVRSLLAQGKLNISVAGRLYMRGDGATANRGFGVAVGGPELRLDGTYATELCEVPNNPNSPLTQDGIVETETEYEEIEEVCEIGTETQEGSTTVLNDGAGPVIASLRVMDITSTGATIVWATDEGATSQVYYGIGNTANQTALDENLKTFHQVRLTGLVPYKFYDFQVVSVDRYGNSSISSVAVFTTLR